jgi:hypothetical protein
MKASIDGGKQTLLSGESSAARSANIEMRPQFPLRLSAGGGLLD